MACGHFDVFEYVLLPDEHGKGSAADDNHNGRWDPSAFSAEVHMAFAADVRLCVDI